jgi:hypothetical protein
MTDHHHKVFNTNDYIPKRFGLNYSPPQIIIEYLAPSTGKLYHHKMRLHKFTKEKSNAEIMKELYDRHQVYLDKKKVSSEQLIKLIERLKQNFVPRKKKSENQDKKPEAKKEQKLEETKKSLEEKKEVKKEEKKEVKKEEKKEVVKEEKKEEKKELKKEEKSEEIEEDFDFGEIESEKEKSKEEQKKEAEVVKPKEPEKKAGKKMDDELEEEEEEYGFDEFEDEDLNKLDDSALNKKKAEMDIEFEKNNIKKGDAKFQYDVRKEFDHEQYAAEWDDDSY